jgi:TIR domain
MDEEDARSVKIFCSYAHKDEELKEELFMHLGNRYPMWHDRDINGGADWAREIDVHLNSADIILLLISVYFMNSNYCKSIEMTRALERQANGRSTRAVAGRFRVI